MEMRINKTITLPLELCQKIIALCESTGKSFTRIIEEALKEYIEKEESVKV